MVASLTVFLDFSLPNATTWLYFSWLLAIALFLKFSRLLCIRNWDVITVFILVPGLLVLQGTRTPPNISEQHPAVQLAGLIGQGAAHAGAAPTANLASVALFAQNRDPSLQPGPWIWWAYLWLLAGSAYLLCRCLFDLTLVQRPALGPNLTFGGLAWLAGALAVCLIAVALRPHDRSNMNASPVPMTNHQRDTLTPSMSPTAPVGPVSASLGQVQSGLQTKDWLLRGFAVLGHLAVVVGLMLVGRWHFNDASAGMAAATFYLMSPYTGMFVGQAHHVWPMALVVWALAMYRVPSLSGALLGLAAGTMYFPVVILPVWVGFYWGRGAGRFVFFCVLTAALSLAATGLLLWVEGDLESSIREALGQAAWQPWRVPTTESFWREVHWAYRIPIFIAYCALVVLATFWPRPKNLANVIALSAALLIGIQFWYADHGGVYVLWYLPLLMLLIFRPNLEDRRPVPIQAETDWIHRLGRSLGSLFHWLMRGQETVAVK